ncbi:sugar MFS transporter [Microbulbifer yueqingensis]|uniref:MFS transporter, FHS family, L-fucose permease n=1 Tax=Microbulbifer yueqingensis TaxID=658219 RepID=A0A1G9DEL8_9GAMM|nr:sugar MFS transporter [Microbulbifer yueqingensis]SDK62303.1 MFS transporter, FHS family, L-fucose permease [Microbulbifer yueqingensis]
MKELVTGAGEVGGSHVGSAAPVSSAASATVPTRTGLVVLTSLFFIWGFITSLNDILVPHLKNVFELSYTKAIFVQFSFFAAYFIVSIPAGMLLRRVGYQLGLVMGLLIASAGCLIFIPAARMQVYEVFLLGLFVLASGITILQVSANPYVIALGSAVSAPSRLNLTQAFNSLGTTLAPFFGGLVIFAGVSSGIDRTTAEGLQAFRAQEAALVEAPYFWLALVLLLMVAFFSYLRLPSIPGHQLPSQVRSRAGDRLQLLRHPRLSLGAVGIFVYVGAEVAIGSFLVNFFGEPGVAGMSTGEAARYVSYYWGGAMIGRFAGALLLRYVSAALMLATCGLGAAVMIVLAMMSTGMQAVWAIIAVGLFNSIMFPTIFSLALQGLGRHTSQGSGILCMAIVGGAFVPLLQGILADRIGIQLSFLVPLVCYCYIVYYGTFSPLLRNRL